MTPNSSQSPDDGSPAGRTAAIFGINALSRQVVPILTASIVAGLDGIGFAVAVASLLFAGSLSAGLGIGVTTALISSIVITVLVGWRSSIPISLGSVQDIGVAILAVTLAVTAGNLAGGPEARIATAFAIIAISTLMTALVLFATGQFKAGQIVRFFPLEVLAGFMAATGWLLLTGGIAMMTGEAATLAAWSSLLTLTNVLQFLPALALGVAIYFCLTYLRRPYTLIGLLLFATAIFHAWRVASGISTAQAAEAGLLLHADISAVLSLPFPSMLDDVDWATVTLALPAALTVAMLSLFGAMMNISALELATGRNVDMGSELKTAGAANALISAAGGPPAYTDLAGSLMMRKLGVKGRAGSLAVAAVELLGLLYASTIVSYVPTFVAAGLILYYGIDLVKEWLLDTHRKFSLREWLVVVLIVVISALYSFIVAILVGFFIATILFALTYARTSIVRNETTLDRLPSTNDRPPADIKHLAEAGRGVRILQLQGFLFFGTSEQVVSRVQTAAAKGTPVRLQRVIMDFSKVTNMDSASANAFKRVENLAAAGGFDIIYCGLNTRLVETLRRSGIEYAPDSEARYCKTLDLALERAEATLLAARRGEVLHSTLAQHFASEFLGREVLDELFARMTRVEYAAGATLISSGTIADTLFFVESGRATVTRTMASGERKRLRTMQPGSIIGEIAFSLAGERTADVVADQPIVAYSISAEEIRRLEASAPHLAIVLYRLIARALAEKVLTANRMTEHAGQ